MELGDLSWYTGRRGQGGLTGSALCQVRILCYGVFDGRGGVAQKEHRHRPSEVAGSSPAAAEAINNGAGMVKASQRTQSRVPNAAQRTRH